jgi:hypothetical protein
MPALRKASAKKSSKKMLAIAANPEPIKYAKRAKKPFIWFNLQQRPLIAKATGLKRYRVASTKKANSLEKAVADAWRSLTPEQKQPYNKLYREDQKRFEAELASGLVPKPKRNACSTGDPLPEPKKPLNSWALFQQQERKCNVKDSEGNKALLAKWKSLTPDERASFIQKAKDDKDRYQSEYKAWKDAVAAGFGTIRKPPVKTMTSLMIFTSMNKKKIAGGKELGGPQLRDEAIKQWRLLSAEERKKYEDLKDEDRARYQREIREYCIWQVSARAMLPGQQIGPEFKRNAVWWRKNGPKQVLAIKAASEQPEAKPAKRRRAGPKKGSKKQLALPAPPVKDGLATAVELAALELE